MELIQADITMDTTHAMQLKFEQRLDDRMKHDLAYKIARQLMDSNQFIVYTHQSPTAQNYTRTTTTFSVQLYVSYKKE